MGKVYQISEQRSITVKKSQGQSSITLKQKDTDKMMTFTPSR